MKLLNLSAPRTRLGRAGVGAAVAAASLGAAAIMTPGTALAATSAAPPCAAVPRCFGAIASGVNGQIVGFAGGFTTRGAADRTAEAECVARGGVECTPRVSYKNAWGALATNGAGDISFAIAHGTSKAAELKAEDNAELRCGVDEGCKVVVIANSITGPGTPI